MRDDRKYCRMQVRVFELFNDPRKLLKLAAPLISDLETLLKWEGAASVNVTALDELLSLLRLSHTEMVLGVSLAIKMKLRAKIRNSPTAETLAALGRADDVAAAEATTATFQAFCDRAEEIRLTTEAETDKRDAQEIERDRHAILRDLSDFCSTLNIGSLTHHEGKRVCRFLRYPTGEADGRLILQGWYQETKDAGNLKGTSALYRILEILAGINFVTKPGMVSYTPQCVKSIKELTPPQIAKQLSGAIDHAKKLNAVDRKPYTTAQLEAVRRIVKSDMVKEGEKMKQKDILKTMTDGGGTGISTKGLVAILDVLRADGDYCGPTRMRRVQQS